MKIFNLLVVSIIVFFIGHEQLLSQQSIGNSNGKLFFVIYDSIIVNSSSVIIRDYNKENELYVGFNIFNMDILLFNDDGDIIHHFNKAGEGPMEYKFKFPITLKFWDTESIAIIVGNDLRIFSFDGKFINSLELDDETPNLLRRNMHIYNDNKGLKNVIYFADTYSPYGISTPDFYEDTVRKHFININFKDETRTGYIYFEKNSMYRNGDIEYPSPIAISSLNYEKRVFDVIFPSEQKIYRYDIDSDFTLISEIPVFTNEFGKVTGVPFGGSPDDYQKFKMINSMYFNLFSFADTIVTIYDKGINEDDWYKFKNMSIDELNANSRKIQKNMQVVVNGKYHCCDIKLPSSIKAFAYIQNLDEILLYKDANYFDEVNNCSTLLIGRIVK